MSNYQQDSKEKKSSAREFFGFSEVFGYFFRKNDPNRHTNFNLRMMHGINKISIIIFLMGVIYMVIKHAF